MVRGKMGVGFVQSPGQNHWVLTLSRNTRVGGINENALRQLRAELYNPFHHPQFADSGMNANAAKFALITAASVAPDLSGAD
jgi:hypothetical protein